MNLNTCLNIRKSNKLNYPLNKGCVSKDYDISSHKGIDLACNKEGTEVYSTANGIISSITYKSSCGGNVVYIYHNINGKPYTTIYGHLLEVKSIIRRNSRRKHHHRLSRGENQPPP